MDNYFTSPKLLRYFKSKGIAATGTVRVNRMENAPLDDMKLMQKEKPGSSDVVTDISSNITAIRWKYNKVVNGLSTYAGKEPMQYVVTEQRRKSVSRSRISSMNTINQWVV